MEKTRATEEISNFTEVEQPNIVETYIRELLDDDDGKWKSQQKITDAINKAHRTKYAQTTILRALNRMKAKKIDGFWTLEADAEHKQKIADLKEFMEEAATDDTHLVKNPTIYILRTRPSHNTLLAKKIRDVYKNEICSIVCPNLRDLVIFYGGETVKAKNGGFANDGETVKAKNDGFTNDRETVKDKNDGFDNDFEKAIVEILGESEAEDE